ncbi:MAG: hypothetical protein KGS72_16115 [Cyanobacteria bacterium REEB67]|nr:hypothetical protein [Cyanobacteria bacterium REEB67]
MDNSKEIGAPAAVQAGTGQASETQQNASNPGQWKVSQEAIDRANLDKAIHDEASHSLFLDSMPYQLRPSPHTGLIGPPADNQKNASPPEKEPLFKVDHEDPRFRKEDIEAQARNAIRQSEAAGPLKGTPGYKPADIFNDSKQHFIDDAEDKVFPGFGRIQSKNPNQDWRLDYLYSNRCKNSGFGLCFIMRVH